MSINELSKTWAKRAEHVGYAQKRISVDIGLFYMKGHMHKDGTQTYRLSCRFYNGAEKRINVKTGYVKLATDKKAERIYFIECDEFEGYCISCKKKNVTDQWETRLAITENHVFWRGCTGYYNLEYDAESNLYFVNLLRKVN